MRTFALQTQKPITAGWTPTHEALALVSKPNSAKPKKLRQPKTKRSASNLYGKEFDPKRCIYAVSDPTGFWQCGHVAGKGPKELFCGRHATAA
jgi:hypothetical protein